LAQNSAVEAAGNLFAEVTPAAQSLARRLENGGVQSFTGITPSAQPFFAALIAKLFPQRPIVVVTDNLKTQESFQQDLETWLSLMPEAPGPMPRASLSYYPEWELFPHDNKLPHADIISDRLQTLIALSLNLSSERGSVTRSGYDASKLLRLTEPRSDQAATFVVTNVVALLQKTFSPQDLAQRTRHLQRGDKIAPLDLIEWLEEQGYEPEAQVSQKGEISLRGGIVDIFPPTSPWPVRLEFFGDELESLREFDPATQISRQPLTEITLPPAGELGILKRLVKIESEQTKKPQPFQSSVTHPTPASLSPLPRRSVCEDGLRGEGTGVRGENAPSQPTLFATLLDYLPPETILIVCEPEQLKLRAEEYEAQIPADDPFFSSWHDFLTEAAQKKITIANLTEVEDGTSHHEPGRARSPLRAASREGNPLIPDDAHGVTRPTALGFKATSPDWQFTSLEAFRPMAERALDPQIAEAQRREFFAQLHRWLRQDYVIHVICNNDGERERFEEIWKESGFEPEKNLRLHLGTLSRGFISDELKRVIVTDAEIFGRYRIQRPRKLKSPHALAARSALDIDFTDLEEGDLVVHLQYGIGKFLGLKNLPTSTKSSAPAGAAPAEIECLVIEYAAANPDDEPPKLYVPVSEAHLVSKYVGAGKAHPPLNTLGGTRWMKAKEQAQHAVRDVAAELLRIQAARETQVGHPFKADTNWQREFESAFIYEETPDQVTAIAQTKTDMEKPKPMDRLICGDVGFGKTEVAIRAAFKAVMDGRQVAVLVPTTVLAQQHFNNFRERMADYPVRIELLSRFRTKREQARVVKDLAAGSVDIVIGTHRIVQDDIAFKDLGLVVIDEEQRFGVLHKEKFKRLRTLVDVLTLSATPIPRTLYLALTGARDMSTIQTPPHDRLPVETIVMEYDERVIRDAILREISRGGQVFFLHNRVMTIDTMRAKLQALVPNARLVVGHGQMDADTLEEVMASFVDGKADVLLSTTIIESGLDIPNANTIIIDCADRFGLSDLYQLRGRVGRYKHQAYAYLMLPRHARLLTDVRKRISAMKQYASLGSGFKIAMRDLEIRGAGNLLGAEQSGHITAVGFELYCQLLKQSVSSLKGEKIKQRVEVSVKLDFLEMNAGRSSDNSDPTIVPSPLPPAAPKLDKGGSGGRGEGQGEVRVRHAGLPANYITESHHRIEIYRKLAQANEKTALENLQKELRDRFGPIPPPVELLLQIGELKILAADKSVTAIEVADDKLMLTRNGDYITLGGKFPRLTKKEPKARLKEIKWLLLAI
jgi:transcription-repair coupling factor (superfamily II helicase)